LFTLAPGASASDMKAAQASGASPSGLEQGEWASTEWVGDEVDIRFELRLQPVG
jgi:hypothetical protein